MPSSVDIRLWKLNAADDLYYLQPESPGPSRWSPRGDGVSWQASVDEGTYIVQFRPAAASELGWEYYDDSPYFGEGTPVVVVGGAETKLDDVILDPRLFDTWRLAGTNRFETAVEISKQLYGPGDHAPVVYVTNAFNFPDALAAGPAAIRAGGAILSTDPQYLPQVVSDRLGQLAPARVVILGDTKSVSGAVEATIRQLLPTADVDRLGGDSRYATADLIVRDAFLATGTTHAVIATGNNYPDALAAGPAVSVADAPVILVNGHGGLDDRTRALLDDLGVVDAVIVGGLPSVNSQLEAELRSQLGSAHVARLAGADRYETAALINDFYFAESDVAFLTTGANFADALTGGPLAGAYGAPLYLSSADCIPDPAADALWDKQVAGIFIFGGYPSLSPAIDALATC
ncbi:cell wall-binding repeat-containing protein [Microbacterium sp. SS28]|uniref:cell wall-binding repeat-containing protein n=1 Tax=Microbacterium sp. SS28 TaxID=2919948 RepID=UPI001FA98C30|nr:cell wall-binding repeat-containing protein [Microbacterium sp. SS28]